MQEEPDRRLTIVGDDCNHDCLSELLGLSYEKNYLPFMLQCSFIRQAKNNRLKTDNLVPSIELMGHQYSWADFIAENMLNIETTYIYRDGSKRKTYFIRIGRFSTERFTILDQINGSMKFKYTTIRDRQKSSIESVA
jgi:hypothetical protein